MHCANGHENRADARFCRECGLPLAPEQLEPPPPPLSPPIPERDSSPSPVRMPEPPRPAPARPEAAEPAPIDAVPPPPAPPAPEHRPDATDLEAPVAQPPVANPDTPTLPPVAATPDDDDQIPAKQPVASPPPPSRPAQRRRRAWIALVVAALVVVAAAGAGGFLAGRREAGPCEAGVKWTQRPTNRIDGSLLNLGSQAAIVQGGARIGFPSPEEAAAMFALDQSPVDFKEVTQEEWDSLDTVPREGLVFRERPHADGPNRYYYSAGGAVFQVRDPEALEEIGVDPNTAIVIPSFGLDGTRRVPPTGTLLRRDDDETWVIDGGSRRTADRVCDGARVVTLPRDELVLEEIPTMPDR